MQINVHWLTKFSCQETNVVSTRADPEIWFKCLFCLLHFKILNVKSTDVQSGVLVKRTVWRVLKSWTQCEQICVSLHSYLFKKGHTVTVTPIWLKESQTIRKGLKIRAMGQTEKVPCTHPMFKYWLHFNEFPIRITNCSKQKSDSPLGPQV